MDFEAINNRAIEIKEKYDKLNFKKNGVRWNAAQFMSGFVGGVGSLSKIIMAKEGLRHIDNVDQKLAHELSDCLWSILVIANAYNIDLSEEFMKTMSELDDRIDKQLN